MPEILLSALLAGYGIALLAAPLGCFVVWRRMAYFGDTLSHSALLGVSLGLMLDINLHLAIISSSIVTAILLTVLQRQSKYASDTILGILAHSMLSIGLVAVSFADHLRIDMMGYLFGDLLATNNIDLYWIYGGGILALSTIAIFWKSLVALSIDEELAQIEGVPVQKLKLVLTILMALVIAVAMKIVGVLLITALMIIPAATAQRLAHSPEQMVGYAALQGIASVSAGLAASWHWDTPAAPSIVVASFALFLLTQLIRLFR